MLAHATPIAFIATAQPDAARDFYRDTLGLALVEDGPHGLAFMAGPVMLRVQRVPGFTPHPFTAFGWSVEDIEAALSALSAKGVAPVRYDGLSQDEAGIWSPDGGVRVAWFRDPDGNTLSLTDMPGAPQA